MLGMTVHLQAQNLSLRDAAAQPVISRAEEKDRSLGPVTVLRLLQLRLLLLREHDEPAAVAVSWQTLMAVTRLLPHRGVRVAQFTEGTGSQVGQDEAEGAVLATPTPTVAARRRSGPGNRTHRVCPAMTGTAGPSG
jgi:hypothetical protein